jgi:hypothetical protein
LDDDFFVDDFFFDDFLADADLLLEADFFAVFFAAVFAFLAAFFCALLVLLSALLVFLAAFFAACLSERVDVDFLSVDVFFRFFLVVAVSSVDAELSFISFVTMSMMVFSELFTAPPTNKGLAPVRGKHINATATSGGASASPSVLRQQRLHLADHRLDAGDEGDMLHRDRVVHDDLGDGPG